MFPGLKYGFLGSVSVVTACGTIRHSRSSLRLVPLSGIEHGSVKEENRVIAEHDPVVKV